MLWLLTFTPFFLIFEIWQLVLCERYLGIKQLASGLDPRAQLMTERLAFIWSAALFVYWIWIGLVLGGPNGRIQALFLFLVSLGGFVLRRNAPLKWVLVILTFEGAIRIGMLVSLGGELWRHLR